MTQIKVVPLPDLIPHEVVIVRLQKALAPVAVTTLVAAVLADQIQLKTMTIQIPNHLLMKYLTRT